tara:strand:- start:141 stop:629 length:489 start_codon:yes stop_codon:yes gene_type:complete
MRRNRYEKLDSSAPFELASVPEQYVVKPGGQGARRSGLTPFSYPNLNEITVISEEMEAEMTMRAAMRTRDRHFFVNIKNSSGLAEKPSDLIKEQSELISEVGYTNSFMDAGQDRDMSDPSYLWWVVNKGVLNNRTPEGLLFKENLKIDLEKTNKMIERKLKV